MLQKMMVVLGYCYDITRYYHSIKEAGMKIAIGADHRGFDHKEYIKHQMHHITWVDVGAYTSERSDYPFFAHAVVQQMFQYDILYGILLCGTGIGMAITANRYPGIYAALAWNNIVAQQSRQDDNSNILVIPSDYVIQEDACIMIEDWLKTAFLEERYRERLMMIDMQ